MMNRIVPKLQLLHRDNIICPVYFLKMFYGLCCLQVQDGLVLPDKASLYLTAIEDADYKEDKIEC